MRYELLGELRVMDVRSARRIFAPKIEILLVALLIRSGQVVSIAQLTTEIWGERPPRRATAAIHVYISHLRKLLQREGDPRSPVVTRPSGYVLDLMGDDVDVHQFQQLVNLGRSHVRAHRDHEGAEDIEAALALWRGPMLEELRNGPIVNEYVIWIEELRLECLELLAEAKLRLGHHHELVGMLHALVVAHPLREAFSLQLMIALQRSERRAEALSVYQVARRTLSGELGLEPCRALRQAHHDVLHADEPIDT